MSGRSTSPICRERLHVLAAVLTEQGKEQVLSAVASVPAASGAISAPARVALQQIAADLGMTAAHGRGVIAEQLEPRIDTWGPPTS